MARTNSSKKSAPVKKGKASQKRKISATKAVGPPTTIASKKKKLSSAREARLPVTAEFDYSKLSHCHKQYKGYVETPHSDHVGSGQVKFRALWNARGLMRLPRTFIVNETEVAECDSDNMLEWSKMVADADEDKELTLYEQTEWQCPKCGTMNKNDGSYCQALVMTEDGNGEKHCNGVKPVSSIGSWDGCFQGVAMPKEGDWRCGTCGVSNDKELLECATCTNPRGT